MQYSKLSTAHDVLNICGSVRKKNHTTLLWIDAIDHVNCIHKKLYKSNLSRIYKKDLLIHEQIIFSFLSKIKLTPRINILAVLKCKTNKELFKINSLFRYIISSFSINQSFVSCKLTLKDPLIFESCIEIKIKLTFYFHTSLWCLKRFYEGLKGLHKTFWGTTKKCENKNLT